MKTFVLALTLAFVAPSILGGCQPSEVPREARKEKQQQDEDKKALGGEFRKSSGKSY